MGCEAAIVSEHSLYITPRKPRLAHGGFDDPHLQGGFRCHGWRHGVMWSVAAWAAWISCPTSTPVTLPSSLSARPATNTHVTFWGWPLKTIWATGRSTGAKFNAWVSMTMTSACLPGVNE